MVAAGLLETSKDHAAAVTDMAFAMRNAAGNVMDPVNNEPIKVCHFHARLLSIGLFVGLHNYNS